MLMKRNNIIWTGRKEKGKMSRNEKQCHKIWGSEENGLDLIRTEENTLLLASRWYRQKSLVVGGK